MKEITTEKQALATVKDYGVALEYVPKNLRAEVIAACLKETEN